MKAIHGNQMNPFHTAHCAVLLFILLGNVKNVVLYIKKILHIAQNVVINCPRHIIDLNDYLNNEYFGKLKYSLLHLCLYDFGRPRWHLLETLRVSASYRGLRIVYLYDDDHEDFIVSDELQIEYYE